MRSVGLAPCARLARVAIMFEFLKQPISLKRAPSKVPSAPDEAPDPAPAESPDTAAEASSAPTEAPRRRRSAPRPQRTRHVVVERAAGTPIAANLVRDGEVTDVDALSSALSELFEGSGLDLRVRIGIANQRIGMRQIELPPITDAKELDSAVHFQAQNEIPMPIESVVLDYHPLG